MVARDHYRRNSSVSREQKPTKAVEQQTCILRNYRVRGFSLYGDIFCPSYPAQGQEFDDYLTLVLELILRLGGIGFCHVQFTSNAAALQQVGTPTQGTSITTVLSHLRCFKFYLPHVDHLHVATALTIPFKNVKQTLLHFSITRHYSKSHKVCLHTLIPRHGQKGRR